MQGTYVRKILIIALVVGLWLADYGLMAIPAPPVKEDQISGLTQNWDKNLPSTTRFAVLSAFNNQAVRDNNTGLVWEQSPNVTLRDWESGITDCAQKNIGGTYGWRLPSVVELKSLQDPSLPAPFVLNNVFGNVQNLQFANFWSATTNVIHPELAWLVSFWNHDVSNGLKTGGGMSGVCVVR